MNILVDQVADVRERNYNIWPIIDKVLFGPGYYVDSYEDEIDYMQNWIYSRIEWIEDNIDDIFYELVRVDVDVQKWDYDFSAYPNPFAKELRFVFNTKENSTIKIQLYNTTGQCKYTYTKENAIGINDFYLSNNELSSFQKGIYFVRLSVNGIEVKTEKLIRR
jgi:hypothetical protein